MSKLIPGLWRALELSFKLLSNPQQHSGHIPREPADQGCVCLFSKISKNMPFFPPSPRPPSDLQQNFFPSNTCIFNFMRKYGKGAYFLS